MITVKTRKVAWIARWKYVRNFLKDLSVVGLSDIPWYGTTYEQWWHEKTVVIVNRIINRTASGASGIDTPRNTF